MMLNRNIDMQSLKQTRKDKGISKKNIADLLGISILNISQIESGKQTPSILTRRRLETCLGERINFMDVPELLTSPKYPTSWDEVERQFRSLVRMINGLPEEEIEAFCLTSIKHIKHLMIKPR